MQIPYRFRLHGEGTSSTSVRKTPQKSSADKDGYGSVKQKCSWESRGKPFELFAEAGFAAGRQLFALTLIIIQVFGAHSHDNLMSCDPDRYGESAAVFCEYTKAYVRCFPLLALAVSLMVATRMVLNHRVYYQLLKHDMLISFEPLLPSKDRLFQLLLWCFGNALFHFVFNIYLAHRESFKLVKLGDLASSAEKLMAANVLHDAHKVAVFYLVPAVVFLLFLFTSYDTEAFLLPLSKYFEDDFEASRTALKRVRFMKEPDAAAQINRGLQFQGLDGAKCVIADAFRELADAAATDAPAAVARTSKLQLRAAFAQQQLESIARTSVTWTFWPARLLLDPRLTDQESLNFRYAWRLFLGIVATVMLFALCCLSGQMIKDTRDVMHGQFCDLAGIMVELCHMVIVLLLGLWLFRQTVSDFFVQALDHPK